MKRNIKLGKCFIFGFERYRLSLEVEEKGQQSEFLKVLFNSLKNWI